MNCSVNSSIFLILYVLLKDGLCFECNFFNNISVLVSKNGTFRGEFRQMSGCLGPDNFDVVVLGLSIYGQENIPYIGDHAVHNLTYLDTLLIWRSHNIANLSAQAFENLPALTDLRISHTKISRIEADTFKDKPKLEFLDLADNNISEIPTEAFGVKPELEYVILTRNKLEAIDHLWFQHCPKWRYASFNSNKIKIINKNTFQFMPNLIQLLLDFNEITFIEETSFHHLKDVEILSMVHNKLTKLDPNVFGENFKVRTLDLRANFLNFLQRDLLKKISVDVLELVGNPWECSCLDRIHNWMLTKNATSKNQDCRTEPVPQCFDGPEPVYCEEKINPEETELFKKKLKSFGFWISPRCANLS